MKFLRRTWSRYSKLGKRNKKNQKWRRPTGRDNKMREKRKGRSAVVSIGYKSPKSKEKSIILVSNVNDLTKIKKGTIAILGKIGKKKKIEITKIAKDQKKKIKNINSEKYLKKNKLKEKNKK